MICGDCAYFKKECENEYRKKRTDLACEEFYGWENYFEEYTRKGSFEETWKTYHVSASRLINRAKRAGVEIHDFLEIGSAGGHLVADFISKGCNAWGVEQYKPIVEKFKSVAGKRNLHGDARDLVFPDEYFDFVYSSCLCYLEGADLDQAIKEMVKVTKSGGLVNIAGAFALEDGSNVLKDDLAQTVLTTREWNGKLESYGLITMEIRQRFLLMKKSK